MNDIDNEIIRISEELDVPLKKLYMLSNNRIRYHKRNQRKCYSNYRKVIIHRGRDVKILLLTIPFDVVFKTMKNVKVITILYNFSTMLLVCYYDII